MLNIHREFSNEFSDVVICLDKSAGRYWRKDVYEGYKESRKSSREESVIDYGEVFSELNTLLDQIRNNLPWKVIEVNHAEADDIMLILAKEYNEHEKILIYSPDKDMLQAQRNTENVFQYSSLTRKWLVPENKHDNMDHWVMNHVCLGDGADEVPKVVDHTEFSDAFIEYLKENNIKHLTPFDFKNSDLDIDTKKSLLENFNVYRTKRNGDETG